MARLARGIKLAVILLALGLAAGFGLLQTPIGQSWAVRAIERAAPPGVILSIGGTGGVWPFRPTAERIEIADRDGVWLRLDHAAVAIVPGGLLSGRIEVAALTARRVELLRLPLMSASSPPPVRVTARRIAVERLEIAAAVFGESVVATLAGEAELNGQVAHAALDLHRIDGEEGGIAANLRLSGSRLGLHAEAREPTGILLAHLLGRSDHLPLLVSLDGDGPIADWHGRLTGAAGTLAQVEARLDLAGDRLTASGTAMLAPLLPPRLAPLVGERIPVSLRASFGKAVRIEAFSVEMAAGSVEGEAVFAGRDQPLGGRLRARLPRLAPFAGLLSRNFDGAIDAEAEFSTIGGALKVRFDGSVAEPRSGIAVADRLLGRTMTFAGSAARDAEGKFAIEDVTVGGAAARLSGGGRLDPLDATFTLGLPSLQPLDPRLAGSLSATLHFMGSLDRPRLAVSIDGRGLAARGWAIDRVLLGGRIADLATPEIVLDGRFHTGGLDGALAVDLRPEGSQLEIPRLRLAAAGSTLDGSLRVALDSTLARGAATVRAADLAPWSRLAGVPLAGGLDLKIGLDDHSGQALEVAGTGSRIRLGAIALDHVDIAGHFADLLRNPSGNGRLSVTAARALGADFATAALGFEMPRPGHVAFHGEARGRPLSLTLDGDGDLLPGGGELRIAGLSGSLGRDRLTLRRPVVLAKRGADISVSDLALDFGGGRIDGGLALHGENLSAKLKAADVALAGLARLAGYTEVGGIVSAEASLGGSFAAPQGQLSLQARELRLAHARQPHMPSLGITASGDWHGRDLSWRGQVTGLKNTTVGLDGSLPLTMTGMSEQAPLTLHVHGAGQLADLADLLPLGEDRLTGGFALDASIGGSLAAPAATGRLKLTGARYHNFASGAVLAGIEAEIDGDRDRFRLDSFSAGDGAGGNLKAEGEVALSGPDVDLAATLAKFRIAARDEAVVTASGRIAISGKAAAPKVAANLTVDAAQLRLPDRLPPELNRLDVTYVDGRNRPPAARRKQPPAVTARLAIGLDLPGPVFVRGRGLESEWRGHIDIAGSSAAPKLTGSLEAIHGTFDLLGKTFRLSHGRIGFDGSSNFDPTLDVLAEIAAADVTAQARITGSASAPRIALGSTPPLPQDEVLSRVLFNRGVGQITAGEGLQLADAAASLAGGGPGIIDRLRSAFGLDRLSFGTDQKGVGAGILNPRALPPQSGGGAGVSGGKYVAEGVYVGVKQGLSPSSSKVTVEIELLPHLSVDTEVGESRDRGIGLSYKYDY